MQERAFWTSPGRGEIRAVTLAEPGPDQVRVRTSRSAVSRGTELLVFRGGVPPGQRRRMRAPYQAGEFPGPVKYGYLSVGTVEAGDPRLLGRTVFCLYPHQTAYVVPADAVSVVPEGIPTARAVLAGIVETAVNAPCIRNARECARQTARSEGLAAMATTNCGAGMECPSPPICMKVSRNVLSAPRIIVSPVMP